MEIIKMNEENKQKTVENEKEMETVEITILTD
jgi:hypothetical protein